MAYDMLQSHRYPEVGGSRFLQDFSNDFWYLCRLAGTLKMEAAGCSNTGNDP